METTIGGREEGSGRGRGTGIMLSDMASIFNGSPNSCRHVVGVICVIHRS